MDVKAEQGDGLLALHVLETGPKVGGLGNPVPGHTIILNDSLVTWVRSLTTVPKFDCCHRWSKIIF